MKENNFLRESEVLLAMFFEAVYIKCRVRKNYTGIGCNSRLLPKSVLQRVRPTDLTHDRKFFLLNSKQNAFPVFFKETEIG